MTPTRRSTWPPRRSSTSAAQRNGAVLVLRDRSLQKRLLQLESERERFASIGQLATGLAHEIKNPLGGIRGAAELLAHRARTTRRGRRRS